LRKGSVYKAALFDAVVAFKAVLGLFAGNGNLVEMLIGEARLAADLVHQKITEVYKVGRLEGQYPSALEFVNGINLRHLPHACCAVREDSAPSTPPRCRKPTFLALWFAAGLGMQGCGCRQLFGSLNRHGNGEGGRARLAVR
jgi:hypothetical protein